MLGSALLRAAKAEAVLHPDGYFGLSSATGASFSMLALLMGWGGLWALCLLLTFVGYSFPVEAKDLYVAAAAFSVTYLVFTACACLPIFWAWRRSREQRQRALKPWVDRLQLLLGQAGELGRLDKDEAEQRALEVTYVEGRIAYLSSLPEFPFPLTRGVSLAAVHLAPAVITAVAAIYKLFPSLAP